MNWATTIVSPKAGFFGAYFFRDPKEELDIISENKSFPEKKKQAKKNSTLLG
jgi:hypothetical protein